MFSNLLRVALAGGAAFVMIRIGYAMMRGLGTPLPAPPPPGELRRVKLQYRCSLCGAELRMTLANDQIPEAPRHCMEDMDLVATPED